MTIGDLLAAWYWRGPLGSALVAVHQPVSAETASDRLAAVGLLLESATVWKPSSPNWLTGVWYAVTVVLGKLEDGQAIELYVPESASPAHVAAGLISAGQRLLAVAVLDVVTTSGTSKHPAGSHVRLRDPMPLPAVLAEPDRQPYLYWAGPR